MIQKSSKVFGLLGFWLLLAINCSSSMAVEDPTPKQDLPKLDLNDYDVLPCATPAEFDALAAQVHLKDKLPGNLCDGTWLAKLGKVLKMMKSLEVTLPPDWKGGAKEALQHPLDYVANMNRGLGLDLSQTSLAYNTFGGKVNLGAGTFNLDPLELASTLIHESRHSAFWDPGHVTCTQGDAPFRDGGCDAQFRIDKRAGSYAYEVAYLLGLAKTSSSLTRANKEYLRAVATGIVGTRFNELPPSLALPYDLVTVLDEQGRLSQLHPFIPELISDPVSIPNEKIKRIEFNAQNNGVFGYTEQNRAFTWKQGYLPHQLGKDLLGESAQILDVATLSFGGEIMGHFITGSGKIVTIQQNTKTAKYAVYNTPWDLSSIGPRELLNGGPDQAYIRSVDGTLYGYRGSNATSLDFQSPGGWVHNSTGVLYRDLFGVSAQGELRYFKQSNFLSLKWGGASEQSEFQSPTPAVKYVEGTTVKALLDAQGGLSFQRFGDSHISSILLSGSKIVDVAIQRRVVPAGRFFEGHTVPPQEFHKQCGVGRSKTDPWAHRWMGVNKQGQLVFEGETTGNLCQIYTGKEKLGNLVSAEVVEAGQPEGRNYSKTVLRLKDAQGKVTDLAPYQY